MEITEGEVTAFFERSMDLLKEVNKNVTAFCVFFERSALERKLLKVVNKNVTAFLNGR